MFQTTGFREIICIHHPTMRENHRDTQSDLTRRVLYFLDKKFLTRSSMCIEDNKKKITGVS